MCFNDDRILNSIFRIATVVNDIFEKNYGYDADDNEEKRRQMHGSNLIFTFLSPQFSALSSSL